MQKRTVFYISDGTGITTETLGHALMTQFSHVPLEKRIIPYVDSPQKARDVVRVIQETHQQAGVRPIVFSTLVDPEIRDIIRHCGAFQIDFFATFTSQIEEELRTTSQRHIGQSHGIGNQAQYDARMAAIHFALQADDGQDPRAYAEADLILVGLSRSGKTPTSLYIAIHYGIRVANYPLTEEDLQSATFPPVLAPYQSKLFGLVVEPRRLHQIRQERQPNSRYADLGQCQWEARLLARFLAENQITHWDATHHSIEEIASRIMSSYSF